MRQDDVQLGIPIKMLSPLFYSFRRIDPAARAGEDSDDAGGRSRKGVTAHGGPSGPLQFDRLGSYPGPPTQSSALWKRSTATVSRLIPSPAMASICGHSISIPIPFR